MHYRSPHTDKGTNMTFVLVFQVFRNPVAHNGSMYIDP